MGEGHWTQVDLNLGARYLATSFRSTSQPITPLAPSTCREARHFLTHCYSAFTTHSLAVAHQRLRWVAKVLITFEAADLTIHQVFMYTLCRYLSNGNWREADLIFVKLERKMALLPRWQYTIKNPKESPVSAGGRIAADMLYRQWRVVKPANLQGKWKLGQIPHHYASATWEEEVSVYSCHPADVAPPALTTTWVILILGLCYHDHLVWICLLSWSHPVWNIVFCKVQQSKNEWLQNQKRIRWN